MPEQDCDGHVLPRLHPGSMSLQHHMRTRAKDPCKMQSGIPDAPCIICVQVPYASESAQAEGQASVPVGHAASLWHVSPTSRHGWNIVQPESAHGPACQNIFLRHVARPNHVDAALQISNPPCRAKLGTGTAKKCAKSSCKAVRHVGLRISVKSNSSRVTCGQSTSGASNVQREASS